MEDEELDEELERLLKEKQERRKKQQDSEIQKLTSIDIKYDKFGQF